MKSLLQHLENESLLLLYIAGELPLPERQELELMLQRDSGLRAQLDSLRAAESVCFDSLAVLDASEPLRPAAPVMRNLTRAMEQWQVDRLARPVHTPPARSMVRLTAWSAGSVVAALLVFCVWWGFRSDPVGGVVSTQPANLPPEQVATLNNLMAEKAPPAPAIGTDANAPAGADAVSIVTVDASSQKLGELESVVSEDLTRD